MSSSMRRISIVSDSDISWSAPVSMATPFCSMRASTRDERHLDLVEEAAQALLVELGLERLRAGAQVMSTQAQAQSAAASTSRSSQASGRAFLPVFRAAPRGPGSRGRSRRATSQSSASEPSSGRPAPPPSPRRKAAIIVSNSSARERTPWLASARRRTSGCGR